MLFFLDIVHRFGVPNSIIMDNGTQFTGKKFFQFCNEYHIHVDWAAVAHPHTNVKSHMDEYSPTRLFQSWMPAHPIGTCSSCLPLFSLLFYRVTTKNYLHKSKWGPIPRNPSHSATNASMCWIPLGLRCCSSIL